MPSRLPEHQFIVANSLQEHQCNHSKFHLGLIRKVMAQRQANSKRHSIDFL